MAETMALRYDLRDLPTAQHRAGLAGLVLVAKALKDRGLGPLPEVDVVSASEVRVGLAQGGLATLLNDVYAASIEELPLRQQRKGQEPLRIDEVEETDSRSGKKTVRSVYVYPQIVPRAAPLETLGMPPIWLKLWRDAVWGTVRGIPMTRLPYEQRAASGVGAEVARIWRDLSRGERETRFEVEVSSALFIGAQAHNAERVPFRGQPANNLLLHFWQMVAGVGEVRRAEYDRKNQRVDDRPAGYVFAVPDVSDLEEFCDAFSASVGGLGSEVYRYRPRDAVLSLPAEGGLQFLRRLAVLAKARAAQGEVRYAVSAIEVYHLEKRGNTIPLLATARVPALPNLAEGYEQIVQARLRSPIFRAQLIRNLLDGRPWYGGFGPLFDSTEPGLLLNREGGFGSDAGRKLAAEVGR